MIEWYVYQGTYFQLSFKSIIIKNNATMFLNWTQIEIFKYPPYDWEYKEQVTSTETEPVCTRVQLRLWR